MGGRLCGTRGCSVISFSVFSALVRHGMRGPASVFFRMKINYFSGCRVTVSFRGHEVVTRRVTEGVSGAKRIGLSSVCGTLRNCSFRAYGGLGGRRVRARVGSYCPHDRVIRLFGRLGGVKIPLILVSSVCLPGGYLVGVLAGYKVSKCGTLFISGRCKYSGVDNSLFGVMRGR